MSINSDGVPINLLRAIGKISKEDVNSIDEYLLLAIVYNVIEAGFKIFSEPFHSFETTSYNAKMLAMFGNVDLKDIYTRKQDQAVTSYLIKMRFHKYPSQDVNLLLQPSANSASRFLVVNFFLTNEGCVEPLAMRTNDFIRAGDQQRIFKNFKDLSLIVKNFVWPVKSTLLLKHFSGCVPHLQRLPDHVLKEVMKLLKSADKRSLMTALSYELDKNSISNCPLPKCK